MRHRQRTSDQRTKTKPTMRPNAFKTPAGRPPQAAKITLNVISALNSSSRDCGRLCRDCARGAMSVIRRGAVVINQGRGVFTRALFPTWWSMGFKRAEHFFECGEVVVSDSRAPHGQEFLGRKSFV